MIILSTLRVVDAGGFLASKPLLTDRHYHLSERFANSPLGGLELPELSGRRSSALSTIRSPDGKKVTSRVLSSKPLFRALVVIPAYNESGAIGDVVRRCRPGQDDRGVLVVSDCSSDDTANLARAAGASVLELSQQIGAWGATQTGFRQALRCGVEQVITIDGDGQHDPACIPALQQAQRDSGADVVIGTFAQRLSPAKRLAWRWFRALTGLKVEDLTSGLRVYNRRALRILASSEATMLDYQDVGVLLLLRRYGLSVHEVPVRMHPRRDGKSRVFSSWLTVARYMAHTTVLSLARGGGKPRVRPARDGAA